MSIAETAATLAEQLRGDCATDLAAVSIAGAEAAQFLQGQLTINVETLASGQHRLAAWCNAKGRVWTLMHLWRHGPEEFTALIPAALQEPFIRRLRMFVLRSKVTVDAADLAVIGHCGPSPDGSATGSAIALPDQPGALVLSDSHSLIVGNAAPPPALDAETWRWRTMVAGQPQLPVAEQEQHIPQSLSLIEAGAVDFNKGCYPGQEIVARVHYRGRAPQMLETLYWTDAAPAIDGHEIARATHAGITVCQVVVKRPAEK